MIDFKFAEVNHSEAVEEHRCIAMVGVLTWLTTEAGARPSQSPGKRPPQKPISAAGNPFANPFTRPEPKAVQAGAGVFGYL